MATFRFPDDFKEHKQYIVLLKKALLMVKPGTEKKFLYFKEYPFGAKKFQLVLLDFDLNCKAVITKAGHKVTAEGTLKLTEQDELNFEATIGSLKRIKLKKYFGTMGPGIKAVYVPPGEVDEEVESVEREQQETATIGSNLPPPPTTKPAPDLPLPPPPDKPLPPVPDVPSPMNEAMKKKMEFEEKAFALRKRLEELRKQPVDSPYEQLKTQVLEKAGALVASGRFPDATLLIEQYLKKVAVPITPTPPKPAQKPTETPPKQATTPPIPPKLSAYMGATKRWKDAKTASANGVFALKTAILKQCDPDLKKAVEVKINEINSILTVMDDGIVAKIQEAGNEADEERQIERNRTIVKFANGILDAVRKHRHADVLDKNPFGTFAIREPVETVLTKIVADFGG